MKKIFTLITMAVMAMTAMAEDYKGYPWYFREWSCRH